MAGTAEDGQVAIEEESLFDCMRKQLTKFASKPVEKNKCTIHRVLYDKRQDGDSPYDPRVISFGPFHRNKERLQPMEKRKWRHLHNLLQGSDDILQEYIEAARSKEGEARNCYYKPEKLEDISSDAFVEMLVLDGCFLIKFIVDSRFSKEKVMDDFGWKLPWIKHDILLLENQIPFFVLEALFEVYQRHAMPKRKHPILSTAIHYLYNTELWDQKRNFTAYHKNWEEPLVESPSHLLHLYHTTVVNSQHKRPFSSIMLFRNSTKFFFLSLSGLVFSPMYFLHRLFFADFMYPTKITAATELQEAGVKLQGSFMDLRFENGTLFVPIFSLDRQSFSLLKNLIALEIYHPKPIRPYMLSFAEFLEELIRTPDDMEVMQENHIITYPSKEEGARLVGRLLTGLEMEDMLIPTENYGYWQHPRDRKEKLLRYCEQPHHRWRARLMRDYFGNPWSTIGILVGVLLLVLTIVQTIFSVLCYFKGC